MADQSEESGVKTRKRSHGKKSRKKGWKKIDVTDVEEHLEDQRLQLRTGGLVAEKTDDQLFFLDKEDKQPEVPLTRKERLRAKPVRCFRHLELDPRIEPARRSATRNVKRKCKNILEIEELEKQGIYTKSKKRKMTLAESDRKKAGEARKKRTTDIVAIATYDLWGSKDPLVAREVNKKTQVEANEHYLRVTKKTRKKIPDDYHNKQSSIPAIEVIPAGGSYNPTYADHQNLLRDANEIELEKIRKQKNDERKYSGFTKVLPQSVHNDWLTEMSAGLFDEAEEKSDTEQTSSEIQPPNAPVRADEKKTLKQRRKEKERKKQAKAVVVKKDAKRKLQDVYQLKRFKKEIVQKEKVIQDNKEKRLKKKSDTTRIKKLGRHKYIPPRMDYQVTNEISGTLRLLKSEGNVLLDRYKSLQRRNIIEPRVVVRKKRRYKLKVYEKRSYREFK